LGTSSIINYLPNQAAKDTHRYYMICMEKLSKRRCMEEEAKASGQEIRHDIVRTFEIIVFLHAGRVLLQKLELGGLKA